MSDKNLPENIKNTLVNLSGKIYDDIASPPLKQVGQATEGLMKFVALPFKCLGMTIDELEKNI